MEYYLTVQRNEVLVRATTWMNLESIMFSAINHTQKEKYCMITFICSMNKQVEKENSLEVIRCWARGEWEPILLMNSEYLVRENKKLWK